MCAIAGFYGFRDDSLIKTFSAQLAHRGPDGEGTFLDDKVSLLNRRLAIIDRAGGDQPVWNENKTIGVVYNGEIYNYRELRQELTKKGHVFATKSDTEVIVHGYEEWGVAVFDQYNGMFGVALYDIPKNKLILARDHFGIKPLYYAVIDKNKPQVIFSSEIKPILYSGKVPKKVNETVLYRYLRFRVHDDGEETFFSGISRVMPGEYLTVTPDSIKKGRFSHLEDELRSLAQKSGKGIVDSQQIAKFGHLLTESVQRRLISEVPVGSCLSGGLDSSSITILINKLLKEKVSEAESVGKIQNTFSAIFPGGVNDEKKYIDAVCASTSVNEHTVSPQPEELFQDIQDFVKTQEEPTISSGPYAQYQVMRLAHNKVTVLLDGQGADEMMAGYMPYFFVYLRQLFKNKQFILLINECLASSDVVIKYFGQAVIKLFIKRGNSEIDRVLSKHFTEQHSNEKFSVVTDNLKSRLLEDIFHHSLPSLLRYEDRNSMRYSIEGRVPFLDFTLIRYLFSLPDSAIIQSGWNKYILREAMKGKLPELIRSRRNKIGFTTPEKAWFLRMKNKIYSLFLSESFQSRPYFNGKAVLALFQQFIEGKYDDTLLFWRLMNAELWLREFIDEKKAEKKIKTLPYAPNEGKQLYRETNGIKYARYPVKTDIIARGDLIADKIIEPLKPFFQAKSDLGKKKWFIVVSEKIVAISQGRAYFLWEIKPSVWANILSSFVKRTPYGIGLGSPWTMQLAIQEVGLPKILFACFGSIIGKLIGKSGIFYQIAGRTVAAIDGPTEYSLYPSNVSAKLGPKNPHEVAQQIREEIQNKLSKEIVSHFLGVIIIDANDIGRNILGNASDLSDGLVSEIFKDNPMGQSDEQTPVIAVIYE